MSTIDRQKVIEALKTVNDPEFGVDLYNLGLVYGIDLREATVRLSLTLTSLGCPTASLIEEMVREAVGRVEGVRNVELEWTFSPPWTPASITDEGREILESMGF